MQISPPFGYQEVVPFLKTQKVRLPAPGQYPEFVLRGNAIPVSFGEFQPVARDYPIVFTTGDNGASFGVVAVLGIAQNENLFHDGSTWAPGVYIPAYARRYPFCMAKVSVNRVERPDRLICVEKAFIDDAGEALFDASGTPGAKWQEMERLLKEYETDVERVREMCSILTDYGLFEPFNMQATFKGQESAPPMQMTGMHRIAEKKIEKLTAEQLRNLVKKGILARIYMHLLSMENFGRLLERKAARKASA